MEARQGSPRDVDQRNSLAKVSVLELFHEGGRSGLDRFLSGVAIARVVPVPVHSRLVCDAKKGNEFTSSILMIEKLYRLKKWIKLKLTDGGTGPRLAGVAVKLVDVDSQVFLDTDATNGRKIDERKWFLCYSIKSKSLAKLC